MKKKVIGVMFLLFGLFTFPEFQYSSNAQATFDDDTYNPSAPCRTRSGSTCKVGITTVTGAYRKW